METPYNRPPARNEPPPLLPFPPDTAGRPTTDEGVLGTRRVPAPSPGRPGLLRNNSMDFLGEVPDLSQGRRKVLNLSAKLQQTSRAPTHPTSAGPSGGGGGSGAGRSLSYVPAHSLSFASFLDGPPPASSATAVVPATRAEQQHVLSRSFGAAQGMEIKVSPASPVKSPPGAGARASAGARAAAFLASQPSGVAAGSTSTGPASGGSGGLEAGVEINVSAKPNRKGKTRSRAPLPPAPVLPPSALGRQCTTATSSPTSSTTRLSTTSLIGPPLLPFTLGSSTPAAADAPEQTAGTTSERRSVRPSTMMRRSSSARDVNPLVRAAASKSVASLNLAKSYSAGAGGSDEGSGETAAAEPDSLGVAPPTPPPDHGSDADDFAPPPGPGGPAPARVFAHTRIIKSKPRLTRSASAFGGLAGSGGSGYALSAPVSPKSRGAADFWLQGDNDVSSTEEGDEPSHTGGLPAGLILGPAIDAGIEVRAAEGDGPKVAVPCPKRTKRSPSPSPAGSSVVRPDTAGEGGGGPTQLPSPPHPSPPLLHAEPQNHLLPSKPQFQQRNGARPRPKRLSFGPGLSVIPLAIGGGLASPFEEAASGGPSANSSPPRPDESQTGSQLATDDDAIMSEPSGA